MTGAAFPALAASTIGGLFFAVDSSGGTSFNINSIITAGVTPAIVVVLFMLGKLYPSSAVDSLRAENIQKDELIERLRVQVASMYPADIVAAARAERASLETQLGVLHGQMNDRVIPALTLSTQVLDRLAPLMQTEITFRAQRASRITASDREESGGRNQIRDDQRDVRRDVSRDRLRDHDRDTLQDRNENDESGNPVA